MADEFKYSGIGDLRVTSLLHQEMRFLLMDPTDLRSTLINVPHPLDGSAAIKQSQIQMGGAMAAPGQVTQVSNTAVTDASFSLTVAHYALQHEIGYLAELTSGQNDSGIRLLAQKIVGSATLTLTDLVVALFPSLSNSVGTSGVDLDVDDIYDAMYQLHNSLVPGPYNCVLFQQQWNDFQTSLRGETGAMQFQQPTADMLALRGPGYQGMWNNINFWSSDSVTAVGGAANSNGAMYGDGAFAYTEAPVSKLIQYADKIEAMEGSRIFVNATNVADTGKVRLNGHYFPAVAEVEDARGVGIITDR